MFSIFTHVMSHDTHSEPGLPVLQKPLCPFIYHFYTIFTEKVPYSYMFNRRKVPLSHTFISGLYYEYE